MFKRVLLALTFVAALGAGGLGMSSHAVAWDDCGGGYGYAYPAYYPSNYGYGYGYGPRAAYYPSYAYPSYYGGYYGGGHHHHRHHDRGGLSVSFGF